jgi:hypothetical protein
MGFREKDVVVYEIFITTLSASHVRFQERIGEIIWVNSSTREYTPKAGCIYLSYEVVEREPSWWWKRLWNFKCPFKDKYPYGVL